VRGAVAGEQGERAVAGDGEDPPPEALLVLQAAQVAQGAHEGFLDHVRHVIGVELGKGTRHARHGRSVPLVERALRSAIALGRARDELNLVSPIGAGSARPVRSVVGHSAKATTPPARPSLPPT